MLGTTVIATYVKFERLTKMTEDMVTLKILYLAPTELIKFENPMRLKILIVIRKVDTKPKAIQTMKYMSRFMK